MREIALDGKNWNEAGDVYDAFFAAVGAPSWHGRNFDALHDSIVVGQINKVEVPYLIKIKNYGSMGSGAKGMAANFVQLIKELRESGCPVDIETEN
jgi:RNAse (barnase) inhibitor barstar